MRTITINKLPADIDHLDVVKASELTRHQRLSAALERTLSRCSEIHAEFELHTSKLRENSKKEGFEAGFRFLIDQFLTLISDFQRLQQQRQTEFRRHVEEALQNSLQEPALVKLIIEHLQAKCSDLPALRVIIPNSVVFPDNVDVSHYQFTDQQHITIQNEKQVIRFPSDTLSQQWLQQADENIAAMDAIIENLFSDKLRDIANQLISLSNQDLTP